MQNFGKRQKKSISGKKVGNHGISEEVNNLPVYSQKVRHFVGHHAYPCRPETRRQQLQEVYLVISAKL